MFSRIFKSWTGPWTLDSGLWTFPPKTLPPPHPEKNLYISPHKTSLPPKKNSFPQIKNSTKSDFVSNKQVRSVRDFKQTTLFPPPSSPKKPLCLPLKTALSQKVPHPLPQIKNTTTSDFWLKAIEQTLVDSPKNDCVGGYCKDRPLLNW